MPCGSNNPREIVVSYVCSRKKYGTAECGNLVTLGANGNINTG